jgi:hypothetical protein
MIENYKFKYRSRGKYIFVPTERCERQGRRIIEFLYRRVDFPDYFYHYKPGGHIAALHAHLPSRFFFKIDIQNFYYSIARMRVTRALRSWHYPGAGTLAKWSCVVNPLPGPRHVLPIGFVQSPLLASLVLMKSPVSQAIERAIASGVCVSVYLDDFVGSHNDSNILEAAYNDIRGTCAGAGLIPNPAKLVAPSEVITAFNCDLTHGIAEVTDARVEQFMRAGRSDMSRAAFQDYRQHVASRNF